MRQIDEVRKQMIAYYQGDPKRIQHFMKVHSFAQMIAEGENLSEEEIQLIEIAAYTHDIGIKISEEKYGSSAGTYQEKEGPAVAREMLEKMDMQEENIDRICFLIGHHHTYSCIEGMDYQILVEADFLVNIYEDEMKQETIEKVKEKIFRTKTGIWLLEKMYLK